MWSGESSWRENLMATYSIGEQKCRLIVKNVGYGIQWSIKKKKKHIKIQLFCDLPFLHAGFLW